MDRRRIVLLVAIAVVTATTGLIRFSGLNPDSLWYDDLAWATLTRAPNISAMLRAPTNAPPGFLMLLRVSRSVFVDPEWSMQLPAYLSGLAAIPVMALLARRLTGSDGLAIVAAALTALNPLLAHYSLYVKQYSLDFLATATILLATVSVLDRQDIRPRDLGGLLLLSAFALLFSVGSVFISSPAVAIVALRGWSSRGRGTAGMILLSLAFGLVLVGAFSLFQSRAPSLTSSAVYRAFFSQSFNPRALSALLRNIAYVAEISLPSWAETEPWNPTAVAWSLPFIGLGLAWLFVRKTTRSLGWILLGFVAAFSFAAYTNLYPLTTDRRTMFMFPVFIVLAVMGVHGLSEWLPRRENIRLALGLAVAVFALYAPIRVVYWAVNDKHAIERISRVDAGDGLILSPDGLFLAGYYGPWAIAVSDWREVGPDAGPDAVNIVRNLTTVARDKKTVQQFLGRVHPPLIWFIDFRGSPEGTADVMSALAERGYDVQPFERTTKTMLYVGVLK